MSQKTYYIEDLGDITFYKNRNSKNIRIKLIGNTIKVSLPYWAPYATALAYVKQKKSWIHSNMSHNRDYQDNSVIAGTYRLRLLRAMASRYSSSIENKTIYVKLPNDAQISSSDVQKKIHVHIIKHLRLIAEDTIVPLVRTLSEQYNFTVKSITIKQLTGRWGSCTNKGDLVFNLFLIQMPSQYIDYVIFHELSHTVHLNHSRQFWQLVESHIPNYKLIKKEIKKYSPTVIT